MTIPFPHPHRHHLYVHIPCVPLVAILVVAAAAAALAFILVDDHPWAPASSGSSAVTAGAVAVPMPESQSSLSSLRRAAAPQALWAPVTGTATVSSTSGLKVHQLVRGATLDPRSAVGVQPPAPRYLPGSVANPHPLNVVAGEPR